MTISFFYLLVLALVHLYTVVGLDAVCHESRCNRKGPSIRFPFRLKDQPQRCGYPGFELSCTENGQTVLKLPTSVELYVTRIDYHSQTIYASDPNGCLPKQARNFNLSTTTSVFRFKVPFLNDYIMFNCTSVKRNLFTQVPCLSSPGYDVYAFDSDILLMHLPLDSCTKMYTVSSVPEELLVPGTALQLNWSVPVCGTCEAQNKVCGFENFHSTSLEIACFDKPKMGLAKKLMIAGVTIGTFLLVSALVALSYFYHLDKKKKENDAKIEKFLEDYKALKPARYSYADLKRITNGFNEKLGQGTYGTVFKGKLSNEILVAVKILNEASGNGEEFVNEVKTMGRIHHVNVVRLVGYCADGFWRALIYEFLPNESLEKFILSNPSNASQSLGWNKLQDIALGIARGIEYLHNGCEQQILHFDIKPHNVLLDENFTPKISDFGLAKLCSKDQSAVSMTAARGTMGYIAPEVYSRNFGNVSHKSDVYSFGMLILEMVGGTKNSKLYAQDTSQVYFPEWVYKHLNQGDEIQIQVGKGDDANANEIARKLAIIGLWCIQWYPAGRPSMKTVEQMLEGKCGNLTMPPNPFASEGPQKTDSTLTRRRLYKELEVISGAE